MVNALKSILDLTLPRSCTHCRAIVDGSPYDFICSTCALEIIECRPPACKICGYPFFGNIFKAKTCPHCTEFDPVFDQGKSLFIAKGGGRSLIHALKYRRGLYVLDDLYRMVIRSKHYLEYIQHAVLVPVPLHPARLRERGFDQSKSIARMLVRCTGNSARIENLLVRKHYTKSQTQLNRLERYPNVRDAFTLARNPVLASSKSYILVDDVFTTGSTLNACAHVLRRAGANKVKVVTIGHG